MNLLLPNAALSDPFRVERGYDASAAGGPGEVYPVGAGADGSVCQRPKSFPSVSLQTANQPMSGTGRGSFASPPSSFTRAAPALMSSTAKYERIPRLPGSMLVIAAPAWSAIRAM